MLPAPPELFFANMISGSSIVKVVDSIVVVEPFTVKLPPTVTLPEVSTVVNVPAADELAPITAPSIAPPLMSTVLDSKVTPLDTTNFLSTVICSELLVVTKVM